jgi:alkylated DNA nucleotide flippase Atl1
MRVKKNWQEKLDSDHGLPEVKPIPVRMRKRFGKGTIVVPTPREVDSIIARVPKGKLITIQQIADRIAKTHGATIGCTVTIGIFAWIAAFAADEREQKGDKNVTPYWRVLKQSGEINVKYPGGLENAMTRLEAEGHEVLQEGKKIIVEDFEKKLVR